jgi:hypothetical protein
MEWTVRTLSFPPHLSAIIVALTVACCVGSVSYRAHLANGFSEEAKSACADHNSFYGAYRNCPARFSQAERSVEQPK